MIFWRAYCGRPSASDKAVLEKIYLLSADYIAENHVKDIHLKKACPANNLDWAGKPYLGP